MKLSTKAQWGIVVALLIVVGSLYTAYPAYRGYQVRANATQCMASVAGFKLQFVEFIEEKKRFPESLQELDAAKDMTGDNVESISIVPNGFLLTCGEAAMGVAITYTLQKQQDQYTWSCEPGAGARQYVGRCM